MEKYRIIQLIHFPWEYELFSDFLFVYTGLYFQQHSNSVLSCTNIGALFM